jgi:hypothetical protein
MFFLVNRGPSPAKRAARYLRQSKTAWSELRVNVGLVSRTLDAPRREGSGRGSFPWHSHRGDEARGVEFLRVRPEVITQEDGSGQFARAC